MLTFTNNVYNAEKKLIQMESVIRLQNDKGKSNESQTYVAQIYDQLRRTEIKLTALLPERLFVDCPKITLSCEEHRSVKLSQPLQQIISMLTNILVARFNQMFLFKTAQFFDTY